LQQYCYSYVSHILSYWYAPAMPLPNTAVPSPNAACPYRNHLDGPWQHVFPDSLRLSRLTELETAYGPSWKTPELDRLVSSCSLLQKLSLRCTPGLQLTALLQLTDLVQLWLWGKPDSSTMASLAQLSGLHQLQRLAVTDPCRFSGRLFMPLTALTQLTCLALPDFSENGSSMDQVLLQLHGRPLRHVHGWPRPSHSVITSTVSEWHGVGPEEQLAYQGAGAEAVCWSAYHLVLACVAFLLFRLAQQLVM